MIINWSKPTLVSLVLILGMAVALTSCCCPSADQLRLLIQTPTPTVTPRPTATPRATPPSAALAPVAGPPEGKYLFVEFWVRVGGSGKLSKIMVDFPDYRFDHDAGTLKPFGLKEIELVESDWGFVGIGYSRGEDAGGGAVSRLINIAQLPFSEELSIFAGEIKDDGFEVMNSAQVELQAVSAEGTLEAVIDGERVLLAPGEGWERTVEADVLTGDIDGHYRVTSSVTNYGWQDLAKIGGY